MSSDASTWEQLGNRFYRKNEVYQMDWVHRNKGRGIGLEGLIVAVGYYGGPIATTRDARLALEVRGSAARPSIDIYSASGFHESSIPWEGPRIVSLGWNAEESLVVVAEDANVHVFDVFRKKFLRKFSMGQLATDAGVLGAKMCPEGRGLVVLTNDSRFFSVADFGEPKVRRLAEIPPPAMPAVPGEEQDYVSNEVSAWTIIQNGRTIEVVVAAHNDLYVLDPKEAWEPLLEQSQLGRYNALSVSPNGRLIALCNDTGKISVFTTNFTENITSFDTQSRVPPRQLEWCGSDSVVAYWDQLGTGTLLMVGPGSQFINYNYDHRIHLAPEPDGVRIITETSHEYLEAVPEVVEKIFGLGFSKYPGAMLYQARQKFEQKDPLADDHIRNIKDDPDNPDSLAMAVEQCIAAAGHELETATQRSLLRAARFGMDFMNKNPRSFLEMVQTLRVLWHVRDYHVAIPLSYRQFKLLTTEALIDRLIARNIFWLAYLICDYLKLTDSHTTNRVLVYWASSMVSKDANDDTIARTITDKIQDRRGISYAEIAREATLQGKPDLAIRLLDHEPKFSEQIPQLLNMGEDALALGKAVESGDTGLAHLVIMSIRQKTSGKGDFLRFIHTRPGARELFLQHCRQSERETLRDYYYQHDLLRDYSHMLIEDAYAEKSVDGSIRLLREATRSYHQAKDPFMQKESEDAARLLEAQKALEQVIKKPFVDLPLGDTIYECILSGDQDRANRLKKDFKVPDKRFWWIKVKALGQAGNWAEMERFSKSKRPPIGYEPFAKECIDKSNGFEAKKYIIKIPSIEERIPLYLKINGFAEAVDCAAQLKNDELYDMIASSAKGRRDVLKMIADRRAGIVR
eukprot:m.287847 g.287847  ORF g.287847 m.287847 type:complete len:856 (+) comp16368_c0_seq11:226-2793(+)